MDLYKLTDENGQTFNNTQWGPGVTHSGTGEGDLCGPGWIHAYTHPLLAILINPLHADFKNPRLWLAEGEIVLSDRGLKVGCKSLTTIKELPVPEVTTEQRIRFGILCALEVSTDEQFIKWAREWLSGEDRSRKAAETAANWAAYWTAEAAARAADGAAYWTAEAAARAADGDVWANVGAAEAAAKAASVKGIDLGKIAEKSVKNEEKTWDE